MKFTHLHVHSHFSILDGMAKIPDLLDQAVSSGMNALALTDHGSMFGIQEFYNYGQKINKDISGKRKALIEKRDEFIAQNLPENASAIAELEAAISKLLPFKAILGVETYVARRTRFDKSLKEDGSGYHLILLAKNKKGYENLCKLVSHAWTEGYYYRPRIDKDLLVQYHEGLIVSSACLGGEISRLVADENFDEAEKAILWFKNLFGDDYYLEVQRHQTDKPGGDRETYIKQMEVNTHLLALAEKTNTKVIATNDVHFAKEEHGEAHDRLICLSTGKDLSDPNRMHYTKQEWLKSPEEMSRIFADIPQVLSNTQEIVDKIESYSLDSPPLMPTFPIPEEFGTEESYRSKYTEEMLREEFGDGFDRLGGYDKVLRIKLEAEYLRELTYRGANMRYDNNIPEENVELIEFELNTMKTMGFPGYFLIVQDFIQAARDMGISVGPGRGSAAGSLVAYCLRITDIDPTKYGLLFERFLNPDRISMPDIDIDFDVDGRGDILKWVTEKYGKDRVAQIVTFGTMATKSSIKDVARVQNLPLSEANRLTKLIPASLPEVNGKAPKVNMKNCLTMVQELKEALNSNDENLSDTLKYAELLEGTVRQTSIHACGVIIGADDLNNFVPLCTAKDSDMLVTQFEGKNIESVGLIKMDFLGLKTLSVIKEALKNIKELHDLDIDIDRIPLDDKKTYDLYSRGATVGIFQFESAGMQKSLQKLKPSQFEDLIAMNALYRPGPMDYIPDFINRKHGIEPIVYDIPIMEKYLQETYGITVYQEQVMLLSRLLANFTRGQSDELRKVMGKKIKEKLPALKEKFMKGCAQNGHDPVACEKIWADWEKFASYAFNKSHATCYSWVSYQTAFLKAHYPAEFMAANLTHDKDDITSITKFMDDCKLQGIDVLGPDVNESRLNFFPTQKGVIRFGLAGIKGVGQGAVEQIILERRTNGPFKGIFDFVERVNLTSCNKKTIESLALSGAFDSFSDIKREQFFATNSKNEIVIDTLIRYGNRFQSDKFQTSNSLFGDMESVEIAKPEVPRVQPWSSLYRLNKEKELVGIYLSAHPLDKYRIALEYGCTVHMADMVELRNGEAKGFTTGGMITAAREGTTKNDRPYGVFTVEDYTGSFEFALFGKDYLDFKNYLTKDLFVMIKGKVQQRGADWKFKKPEQPGKPVEMELKIERITELEEVYQDMVKQLTLNTALDNLDAGLYSDISTILEDHPGKCEVKFIITDLEKNYTINLRSKKIRVDINMKLLDELKDLENKELLTFSIS